MNDLLSIYCFQLPDGSARLSLIFQKIVYTFNYERQQFEALSFDTRQPLQHFYEHKGFESDEALSEATLVYGNNECVFII